MKPKPLNQKKYMVWGHQLDDIGLVIDALSLACWFDPEDDPPDTVFSTVELARDALSALVDRIEGKQEITEQEAGE